MKILQVSPYFHPHIGGVETHVFELSKKLIEKGHSLTVLTSLIEGTKEKENLNEIEIIRVKQIMNLFTTPITPSLKKISLKEYDIIHVHSPPPLTSYYLAKSCKKQKKDFILTYHCDLEIPSFFGRLVVDFYCMTIGKYPIKRAKKIIATTRNYAETSRLLWNTNTIIIPNAVDEKRFSPNIDEKEIKEKYKDEKIVLFVGRLVHHKGIESFIRTAKNVSAKYLIVGEGNMKKYFEKIAKNLGLEKKVIFVGKVSNEELPKYYKACDVFVLPSVSRLEAFGIVALEGMATAKPIVISDIPGVREIIENGKEGFYAEPMNENDFAEKINLLLKDEKLAEEIGKNARKKILENYTWDNVIGRIEELYREVI